MTWKICLLPFLSTLVLGIVLFFFNSQIWGMDGPLLWMPIVSEFLRGTYENSEVIFAGQNLLAVYGNLPFWHVLKWLNVTPVTLLNFTYLVSYFLFAVYSLTILQGLRREQSLVLSGMACLYCFVSPIIINRVYAGHFNLTFGMIPLLVAISFFYDRSWWMRVLSVFALTCSFSIVSYQILAYHLFYIPIWIVWFRTSEGDLKAYLKDLLPCVLVAILFSYPSLSALIGHARDPDNLRAAAGDIVYSYTVSTWKDLPALFFSSYNELFFFRGKGFFHEINYAMGLFLPLAFIIRSDLKKIAVVIIVTVIVLFAFSANTPGLNLLSRLPIIELFRVPQRSLMLPAYLLPLLVFASFQITKQTLAITVVSIIFFQFLPYPEFILIVFIAIAYFVSRSKHFPAMVVPVAVVSIACGIGWKWEVIQSGNEKQLQLVNYLKEIDQKLGLAGTSRIAHFESELSSDFIAAANILGIRTAEGYGHPPVRLVRTLERVAGLQVNPMSNRIELNQKLDLFKDLMIAIGVTDIIYITPQGYFRKTPEEL